MNYDLITYVVCVTILLLVTAILIDAFHDRRAQRQKARQIHEALIHTHPFAAQARPEGAPAQMDLRPRRIRRRRPRCRGNSGAPVADSTHRSALRTLDYRIEPGEFFDQDGA